MNTPIAGLPEIAENQANKAITHNTALRQLEINYGAVISRTLTNPPGSPAEGALYIPATGATGVWSGQVNKIAQWAKGGWTIYTPFQYQRIYSIVDGAYLVYVGSSWSVVAGEGDMTKSVYDPNDDGIVSNAAAIAGTPTAGQYYGTPAGGTTKGFYNLPAASTADMNKSVYDTDDDGIVDAAESIAGNPADDTFYGKEAGNKGFFGFFGKVRSTVLTGLSTATGGAITATDTVLQALGKLQKQVNDIATGGVGVTDGDKGDITVSGTGATWTIDDNTVTFAKLQNINTSRILGRSSASTGDVEEISIGSGLSLSGGQLSATGGGGGGSAITVQDEGTSLTTNATSFNFTGAGVTASNSGGAVTVNIPPGGGSGGTSRSKTLALIVASL
jgi:hypothetical protein